MKKQVLYLGNQLSKHGLNKTTIETLGLKLEHENFTVFFSSNIKSFPLRMLDMINAVFQFRNKIDYVLIDTYSSKAFWYAFFCSQLARIFNMKYIPILHGGDLPTRLKNNPILCKMVFKYAYKNVAPSEYLKKEFEDKGFKNIIHIPNLIEVKNYTFKNRENYVPKLLWVRAFAAIYNPKMAIDVLKKLKEIYPKSTLCMIGPDKDGSLLITKQYAEELSLDVTFTGGLSKEDWISLSQNYNIFINTTHFDNTPVSVMEAMALGLPVVSTNVGGLPFLIDDGKDGLLVHDKDINAMVNKIEFLIKNQEKSIEIAINARRKVELFDWQVIKYKWFEILQ